MPPAARGTVCRVSPNDQIGCTCAHVIHPPYVSRLFSTLNKVGCIVYSIRFVDGAVRLGVCDGCGSKSPPVEAIAIKKHLQRAKSLQKSPERNNRCYQKPFSHPLKGSRALQRSPERNNRFYQKPLLRLLSTEERTVAIENHSRIPYMGQQPCKYHQKETNRC